MKYLFCTFFYFSLTFLVFGQENNIQRSGKVSYITSQNVYVKFESTDGINLGDTLFRFTLGKLNPALIVNQKSSISCVCTPLNGESMNISDEVFLRSPSINEPTSEDLTVIGDSKSDIRTLPVEDENQNEITGGIPDLSESRQITNRSFRQDIYGRVSLSSYNTISGSRANHRMRYRLALRGDHLGGTRLSIDSYITFRHTLDDWDEIRQNINNGLKIYSLSFRYDFSKSSTLSLGRKINPKISSMGAIDGIQYEQTAGNFQFGTLVGSRPDYFDHSLNLNLFQYGAYTSHEFMTDTRLMQNTIGYIEQRNNSKIDRRFIYFQHNSSLFWNLNLFTSAEISLYENINNQPKNVFDLANLYASVRYRFSRKLNVSVSYDNRKNVQYYETFKSFIDQLIDEESRQGLRFNANYSLFNNITWGVNAGWRFQKSKKNLSKNLNSYLTFSRIPALNIRTTVTANFLQTNYLQSKIFGIRVSKELIPRKFQGGINFRMVDYKYLNYETVTKQNIAGINLSWNITKKLTFYIDYEGTIDHQGMLYHRIYTKIIQRL